MTSPEDSDLLAAEYVTGVLDAADRARVEDLMSRDAALAARVLDWQTRLAPLNDGYPEVAPPPGLQARIEARLFPAPARKRWSLPRLLGGALAGVAVAVAVLVLMPTAPTAPQLTASLSADSGLAFQASLTGDQLSVAQVAGAPAGQNQDYQLWVIGPSGVPQSLGLLRGPQTVTTVADLAPGFVLAISLEPLGGSPLPTPSGPVLMTAELISG